MKPGLFAILMVCLSFFLTACSAQPVVQTTVTNDALEFSGEKAFAFEKDFVSRFPNRHSGQPNSKSAAAYLMAETSKLGWNCRMDSWQVINYSKPLDLVNTICEKPGSSDEEIVLIAHHDIAPTTIEGADNDGAGIAILYHLAEIFSTENELPYTVVLLFSDGEEYGMLGTQRYAQTHPDVKKILAGISLDNVGRAYYDGMTIELIGQYWNYGPVWLPIVIRDAAEATGLWKVHLRAPIDQITDQAAPMSLMDQGPLIAAGIPAVGLAGHVPQDQVDLHYHLWHHPDDSMAYQAADTLGLSGKTAEAALRQLLSMSEFPGMTQPYLYFENSNQILTGLPLYLVFIGFVSIFFIGSYFTGKQTWKEKVPGWPAAFKHFLGLWIPLLFSVLLMYGLVWTGLMDSYDTYPATTKDPALLSPEWPAVTIFFAGLALFFYFGYRSVRRFSSPGKKPDDIQVKSLALFILGLVGIYLLFRNPFSLLFMFPVLFWLLIAGRNHKAKLIDIILLLLGGLVVYALIYIFGYTVLRYNLTFLWFLMNMFSIQLISFRTAAFIAAIIAAGLMLVINPPESSSRNTIQSVKI